MIILLQIAPLLVLVLAYLFGAFSVGAAIFVAALWTFGFMGVGFWMVLHEQPIISILLWAISFLGTWVGVLMSASLTRSVPFAETPAGMAKAQYDALSPEQKVMLKKHAKTAASVGSFHLAALLRRKGHRNAARAINGVRGALDL